MAHHILFFDFESYYDKKQPDPYSLQHMAPPNYILDQRWETIGCSFAVDDGVEEFVDGPDVETYLKRFNPATTTTVAFNALFDNCVLAWRYGFIPSRMVCTMRGAVAVYGHELRRLSLAGVAKYLGLGEKGTTIQDVAGMRRADIRANPGLWRAYQAYSNHDNFLNRGIAYNIFPRLPTSEWRIMDRVLRCSVEQRFVVDTAMLTAHMQDLKEDKERLLMAAGANTYIGDPNFQDRLDEFAKTIRSNPQFEAILEKHGVDIEYKQSTTDPERKIPAFAKTDEFMANLQEHPDPDVQALAAIRLGLRSTIEETRGARILSIAQLPWRYGTGTLPIPLRYSGAHTHRLSGDWKINMQNLPAGRGKNKSKLRHALCAPPGHVVIVADKSQIECRINGWLCGQQDLLDIFRAPPPNNDPYSVLASLIFGFKVDKNVHLIERFIGKSGVLGLGFGCGWQKFYNMVVRAARTMMDAADMAKLMAVWTPALAQKSVDVYRQTNRHIVAAWRQLDAILKTSWIGQTEAVKFGPCVIGKGYVEGPGGLTMRYANPRIDQDTNELRYDYGNRSFKMYGSKFLENIVQFLARINTMHDALRISDQGFSFVLQSHDELAWIEPAGRAEECKRVALQEMRRAPSWAKDLPLNADCKYGRTYGDAK